MNNLIVFTNHYPFGRGEEFLETEMIYLAKEFDKVEVFSSNIKDELTRNLPENVSVTRVDLSYNLLDKIKSIKYIFKITFLKELYILRLQYRLPITLYRFKHNIFEMLIADKICEIVESNLAYKNTKEKIHLYSYWMNVSSLAIAKLKKKKQGIKALCRTHRVDLYFEQNRYNYLPFRTFIINNLDKTYVISKDGEDYLIKKLGNETSDKIEVSRLGIINDTLYKGKKKTLHLRIVSCSFIVSVKRIELIINSLYEIDDIAIDWIHIGDGDLRNEIEMMAVEKLSLKPNIKYSFMGHLSNAEVMDFYRNNEVDCFVNVSESEGIPVSIMEANSFSIPVIATNVGGVSEIVNSKNGFLLNKNPTKEEIVSAIRHFYELTQENINEYRLNAYETWNNCYNAKKNYTAFIQHIKEL